MAVFETRGGEILRLALGFRCRGPATSSAARHDGDADGETGVREPHGRARRPSGPRTRRQPPRPQRVFRGRKLPTRSDASARSPPEPIRPGRRDRRSVPPARAVVEDGGAFVAHPADRRGPTLPATLSMGLAGSWAAGAVLVDGDEPARFNR